MEGDRVAALATVFSRAAACVRARGFDAELKWAREASLYQLTEQTFLAELAWCVLNSGMRESVVRLKWPDITQAFLNFASSRAICAAAETCIILARRAFNHEQKIAAIVQGARRVEQGGFDTFKARLIRDPLGELRAFGYIGPVTVFHLARNLGVDCSKPDRHLVRYAARWGFEDVENFCRTIADAGQERLGTVDVVLWRHSVIGCACLADLEPPQRIGGVVIADPPPITRSRATGSPDSRIARCGGIGTAKRGAPQYRDRSPRSSAPNRSPRLA